MRHKGGDDDDDGGDEDVYRTNKGKTDSAMCGSEVALTPDVCDAVGGVLPDLVAAEGELGLALLWRGRVLGQELHDVRVVLVAPQAAFADDVHDAGENVAGAAAEAAGALRARGLLFLARVQDLEGDPRDRDQ